MTLEQHLAKSYDFYQHGIRKDWSPEQFVEELQADADLLIAARAKRAELDKFIKARSERACHVSTYQLRALNRAFEKIAG